MPVEAGFAGGIAGFGSMTVGVGVESAVADPSTYGGSKNASY